VAVTEAALEAAVLPRMIEMVMRVATAGVVAYPLSTVVDVGSIGMSFLVVEVATLLGRMRSGCSRRTVRGDVLTPTTNLRTAAATFVALRSG
jgi:hypothetical protein